MKLEEICEETRRKADAHDFAMFLKLAMPKSIPYNPDARTSAAFTYESGRLEYHIHFTASDSAEGK